MKILKFLMILLILSISIHINAQSADEIIANYFEHIGGVEKWEKLNGIKMSINVNQNGMDIPIDIIKLKGGNRMSVIHIQGNKIKQGVYDGETLWTINFMTQKAEKSNKEDTENMMLEKNDFPDSFLHYKEKNYSVELLGKDTIDGVETFKLKLIKEPIEVDGKKEENVSFYFFDSTKFVPILVYSPIRSGQFKGKTSEIRMDDYREVEGIYFPFSITQGLKGQSGQSITIENIELNPDIDINEFKFPEEVKSISEEGEN